MTDSEHSMATAEAQNCDNCARITRRTFMAGAAGTAVAATAGTASAAETTTAEPPEWQEGRSGLNWSSAYVPNPRFAATLEKAKHRTTWGTDDAALLDYENDSGNRDSLGGDVVRKDTENILSFRADKLEFPDASAFPRGATYDHDSDSGTEEKPVSALDATHWSTTDSGSGTITVSDADIDVSPALEVSTSGVAAGETAMATLDLSSWNAVVDDDAAKRYAQAIVNTVSLSASAVVEVAFIDSDGDEKILKIDSGATVSDADVIATTTGYGQTIQQRFGDLPTVANGDGSYDDTKLVEIRVSEADATVQFPALNAEKMGRWTFGSYLQNEDTDNEERTKRYEPSGTVTATDLGTFSDALTVEDAVFYDLTYDVRVDMEGSALDYEYRFHDATERVGYDSILEWRGKAVLPSQYDLNWQSPAYEEDVQVPGERYATVETVTGVEDVAFEDIDDSSWSSHGGQFDREGATVSHIDPASVGEVVGHREEVLLTESNRKEVEDTSASASGGGGAPAPDSGGDTPLGAIVAIVTGGLGFLVAWAKGLV